jgi:hypothetical protein
VKQLLNDANKAILLSKIETIVETISFFLAIASPKEGEQFFSRGKRSIREDIISCILRPFVLILDETRSPFVSLESGNNHYNQHRSRC